ncbi:IspD/TarI family cytidylyltransferase [uncultured Tolumonas sp.]|uniref:IspD/TarI family cytidylyltransferase n=1 Tax=uncultured Tolumonas sp. TaxID=263765 RepID=UPI00292E9CF5|nr:IspD/TarI family cytidylyltransferase [uncultured Tolumonas sp.]
MSTPSSPAATEPAYLLIPAGGRGLRMGGGVPKQFRDWGGVPLLQATIEAFLVPGMPALRGIALAVPGDRLEQVRTWSFVLPLWVVEGGETRQDSVEAALAALPEAPDAPVLIHDGVRPFPPALPIHEALRSLAGWDGAVLGEASTDTLKRVDPTGCVVCTEPREAIFRAQTPQVARLSTWRHAFREARRAGFAGTDDVSLLERLGLRVRLVASPASNLKLTTPEDWTRLVRPQGVAGAPTVADLR